jgi:hypothetical protein
MDFAYDFVGSSDEMEDKTPSINPWNSFGSQVKNDTHTIKDNLAPNGIKNDKNEKENSMKNSHKPPVNTVNKNEIDKFLEQNQNFSHNPQKVINNIPAKEDTHSNKGKMPSHISANQSPFVRLSIDNDDYKIAKYANNEEIATDVYTNNISKQFTHQVTNSYDQEFILLGEQVRQVNQDKKIVNKFVEVTTKIIYTFEDGTSKEVV